MIERAVETQEGEGREGRTRAFGDAQCCGTRCADESRGVRQSGDGSGEQRKAAGTQQLPRSQRPMRLAETAATIEVTSPGE